MAKRRQVWPRRARRLVQALAFGGFLVYVVRAGGLTLRQGRGDWLMRFSPLSGLGSSLSAWDIIAAFWPALALLAAAMLLGRFFCGWLCPLGTTIDVGDRVTGLFRARRPRRPGGEEAGPEFEHVRGRRLKYYLLAACLVGALLGVSFFGLFDPLSIAVRSYVLTVHAYIAQGLGNLLRALGLTGASDAVAAGLVARTPPLYQLHVVTFAALLGVLALGLARRRFWCRYVCPLGALYALAGRPAATKRAVTDACIECGRCAEACPMSCISQDGHRTLNDECTLCLQCQPVCPTSAVYFLRPAPAGQKAEVDLTRRGALTAVAAGVAAYPVLRLKPSHALAKADPLIRPPLAGRDLDQFLARCLRCGQCMRACPTHVIQPAGLAAGLEGLWTPELVPRLGYCEYDCDACGRACPSGAIPAFSLDEKHATAPGLAYFDRNRCIPWRGLERRSEDGFSPDEHNCGVCEEVCPAPGKAIHFRREYGPWGGEAAEDTDRELRLPYVREEACVGCGFCEYACPVQGLAAVRLTGGFRELPESALAAAEPAPTEGALPARVGDLRIAGPKATYTEDDLFDYIDGEAPRYVVFGFVGVTVAEYTDGTNRAEASVWQFGTPDGAFGAFARDRRGDPVDLGDEGAMLGGSLWARRGRFTMRVLDMRRTPPEQVRRLAEVALEALDEPPAERPQICRRLPREGLDSDSVLFVRDDAPLLELPLAAEYIPEGTFGVADGAAGAYGEYGPGAERRPAALVLIEYPDAAAADAAAGRLAELRSGWGEELVAQDPHVVYRAADGSYCLIAATDGLLAAAFNMPTAGAAEALVAGALP